MSYVNKSDVGPNMEHAELSCNGRGWNAAKEILADWVGIGDGGLGGGIDDPHVVITRG